MSEKNWREAATSTADFSAPLAAGTYLVGDPCYAFTNDHDKTSGADLWSEWLDDSWKDVDPNLMTILDGRVQGMRIAASVTAYGDGEYPDQDGFPYPVDAGLLGAVHVDFIRNLFPELVGFSYADVAAKTSMRLVEFPHPFHVSFDEDSGTVKIGHIEIETGDSPWGEGDDECGNCGGELGWDGECSDHCMEAEEDTEVE